MKLKKVTLPEMREIEIATILSIKVKVNHNTVEIKKKDLIPMVFERQIGYYYMSADGDLFIPFIGVEE